MRWGISKKQLKKNNLLIFVCDKTKGSKSLNIVDVTYACPIRWLIDDRLYSAIRLFSR